MEKFEKQTYMINNGVNKTLKGDQLIKIQSCANNVWPFTEMLVIRK